jgi:formylglycine-generating enzyme required for sulfatase activity
LTEQEPRIFLCHANEDKERVRDLYHQLKAAGYHPWLDKYDLLPGQKWWPAIKKIISDPHNLVVVCLSENSITKQGVVQQEIARALDALDKMPEGAIYLIPARLEPCQAPDRLSELHWVDLFEPDGFEYLTRALDFEIANRKPPAEPEKVKALDVEIGKQKVGPKPAPPMPVPQPFEPELIHIPAGEFLMGSDPSKDKYADKDEQPQHRLQLPEYYITKAPVTNAQYLAFVQATDHRAPEHWEKGNSPKSKEEHPVVSVSWYDAMAYCRWLTKATGKAYRLPSEAEWEKAARGTDGPIYLWGDELPDENRCNFADNVKDTTRVGQYSPQGDSPYGCVDMAGNVWEWTLSLWGKERKVPDFRYPYDPVDGREDLKASDDILRVLRGGSFGDSGGDVRCACRGRSSPHGRHYGVGFRVIVAPGFL